MNLFILTMAIFGVLHIGIWHFNLCANRGAGKIMFLSLMALAVACVLWAIGQGGFSWEGFLVGVSLYAAAVMLYLHWYVGIDRSVSVRILGELVQAPGGRMTLAQLEKVYPKTYMFEHRLDLMVQNGWLTRKDRRYACTPKSRQMAGAAMFLKNLYGLGVTG